MPRDPSESAGFTLVELMVTVAILGVLAAVAIPSYQTFVAKARQTEAKIHLSNVYTVLVTYYAEESSYTGCLRDIGYEPTASSKRFYTHGLSEIRDFDDAECGPDGLQPCAQFNWSEGTPRTCTAPWEGRTRFTANQYSREALGTPTLEDYLVAGQLKKDYFEVTAIGNVHPSSSRFDVWHINSNKRIRNTQPGLQ